MPLRREHVLAFLISVVVHVVVLVLAGETPPIYADDCLPDPPAFENPFTWDGKSPQVRHEPMKEPDPQELADCLRQLTPDSIEAESAHNQRQFDLWDSSKLGR